MANKLLIEKYEYLSKCEDIESLTKEKYECILKSKKLRNSKLCITILGMFITMTVALITAGITFVNSMSSDSLNTIRSIGSIQIEYQKEKKDGDSNKILNILGKASDYEKNIYDASVELKKNMNVIACSAIFLVIIGTIITYLIIMFKENKASECETFEIMINERMGEIKSGRWDKAQKVEMKVSEIRY